MPETEHRCEGMPSMVVASNYEGPGLDFIYAIPEDGVLTHCPWCGVKLEDAE